MREIKFRAWDKNEEMFDKMNYNPFCEGNRLFFKDGQLREVCGPRDETWDEPSDLILMQYTGFKDKNGKEIYEGDILEVEDHVNHVVGFRRGMFMWKNIAPDIPIYEKLEDCHCNVIGNIYENPELLKKETGARI